MLRRREKRPRMKAKWRFARAKTHLTLLALVIRKTAVPVMQPLRKARLDFDILQVVEVVCAEELVCSSGISYRRAMDS
jgi:hypothetical protein